MHLTITNVAKSSVLRGTPLPADSDVEVDHAYIRGDPTTRGPCPGLNALANQGYIPRDGKNLTAAVVKKALMTALHMDSLVAQSLVNLFKPYTRKDGTLDLADTRRHNLVEHDASLTRLDFHQGDNYTFQHGMLEAVIRDADGAPVTLRTLAKSVNRRVRESRAAGAPRLSIRQWVVTIFNVAGVLNVAQDDGTVTREALEALFEEERFPDFALSNPKRKTIFGFLGNAVTMMYWCIRGP